MDRNRRVGTIRIAAILRGKSVTLIDAYGDRIATLAPRRLKGIISKARLLKWENSRGSWRTVLCRMARDEPDDPWKAKCHSWTRLWNYRPSARHTGGRAARGKRNMNWYQWSRAALQSHYKRLIRSNGVFKWQDWATNKASNARKRMAAKCKAK